MSAKQNFVTDKLFDISTELDPEISRHEEIKYINNGTTKMCLDLGRISTLSYGSLLTMLS